MFVTTECDALVRVSLDRDSFLELLGRDSKAMSISIYEDYEVVGLCERYDRLSESEGDAKVMHLLVCGNGNAPNANKRWQQQPERIYGARKRSACLNQAIILDSIRMRSDRDGDIMRGYVVSNYSHSSAACFSDTCQVSVNVSDC